MTGTAVVGNSLAKIDARGKVTGQTLFGTDLQFPNMVHCKVLRSPHPHARIHGINTAKAKALPGVVGIFTAEDVPGDNHYGVMFRDHEVLCREKVRFVGDPVVLVAAETPEIAEEALDLIEVDYEILPAVFDPQEALRPGAPKIHESGNLLLLTKIRKGDVAKGFAESAVIVENTYITPRQEHLYLQPEAGAALVDPEGVLTVYSSTQYPHYDRQDVALAMNWPMHKVRVIQVGTGGAFGGREDISVQILVSLAAVKTKRPAKMVYGRMESMIAHCKRHVEYIKYKTGASREGKILAVEAEIYGDTGAYASWGTNVTRKSAVHAAGPYFVPNVKVDSYAVFTNNTFAGAMRGFGVPQVALAHEAQMDEVARRLGMSPVEIRLINALTAGSETATGQVLPASVGLKECIMRAAAAAGLPLPEQSLREAASAMERGDR